MTRTEQVQQPIMVGPTRRRMRLPGFVAGTPVWARILLIWVGGRILSTLWLTAAWPFAQRLQPSNAIRGTSHGLMRFLTAWDGQYYEYISVHGYPTQLPHDSLGHITQNAWAFLPAFPLAIRALTISTGMPFTIGAPIVATLAGLIATYLLHALTRRHSGERQAMWVVFLFSAGPLSFLLQVGYAESTFLALVFGALLAIEHRRYGLLTVLGIIAAFTRPGGLAIPLTLAIVATVRMIRIRREPALRATDPFRLKERLVIAASGLIMAAAGFAWPVVASHVTGIHDAYLQTEMSWWVNFIGRTSFLPMTPWFLNAWRWLGIGGVLIVIALCVAYVVWLSRPATRTLGVTTVAFAASYALYIFAVSLPMASTPRLLMPLAPLGASPALYERRWARRTLLIVSLALQPICVVVLWLIGPP